MTKNGTFGNWLTWKADQYQNDIDMSRYLVRNECALREGWQACAESKQSELDNLKFEFERSVMEHEECKRYADSLNLGLDKANARIAQLEDALFKLATLGNGNRLGNSIGNCIAIDALDRSTNTWLSEHDKAVEVRVLEEFGQKAGFGSSTLLSMIEARK